MRSKQNESMNQSINDWKGAQVVVANSKNDWVSARE
jgi:hypothetical protein